jgi:CobQ-like glutamine amidotransferase family enzyme
MSIDIALLYPELLGTYGDSGNATVLAQRLRWRGYDSRVLTFSAADAVPSSCDIYVIGGGEDLPQGLAASKLAAGERPLHRAVDQGATVLAVCAGLQVLGESFVGPDGREQTGLGLLGVRTRRTGAPRAVGEVVAEPEPRFREQGVRTLTGFENHGGVTDICDGTLPLARVRVGTGNLDGTVEGAVKGKVLGTYLHGPVLARNPSLADMLLSWVVGGLAPLDDSETAALHAERLRLGPGERRPLQAPAYVKAAALARHYLARARAVAGAKQQAASER